ncbi:TPA: TasA family protein [Clostridium perfringens]
MKKKLLGMLLAGTLMVGAVGSYAWFSDRATVNGDIKLTMGTLDVKIIDAERGWKVGDDTEIVNKENKKSFKNVRSGDTFEREFLVQNVGTLKQRVTVKLNPALLNLELKDGITFDDVFNLSFSTEASPLTLENEGTANFELDSSINSVENEAGGYTDAKKVIVNLEVDPEAMGNEFNALGNEFKEVINLNNIKDAEGNKIPLLVVDAQQINHVEK